MTCPHKYNIQQKTTIDYTQEDSLIKKENRTLIEVQTFGKCDETLCACWNKTTQMCDRR